jgi:hypothetical protein
VRAKLLLDGEGVEILDAFDSVTRRLGGIQMRVLLELMGHEPLNYDDVKSAIPAFETNLKSLQGLVRQRLVELETPDLPGGVSIFSTRTGPGPAMVTRSWHCYLGDRDHPAGVRDLPAWTPPGRDLGQRDGPAMRCCPPRTASGRNTYTATSGNASPGHPLTPL